MCGKHHQDKKKDRDCRQEDIEQDVLAPDRRLFIQAARPSGVFDNDILKVSEVVGEVVGTGVAMRRRRFQSTVDYLLHLRGNGGLDLARRRRLLNQTRVDMRQRIGGAKWEPAGKHFVEDHADRIDVAASIASKSLDLFRRSVTHRL